MTNWSYKFKFQSLVMIRVFVTKEGKVFYRGAVSSQPKALPPTPRNHHSWYTDNYLTALYGRNARCIYGRSPFFEYILMVCLLNFLNRINLPKWILFKYFKFTTLSIKLSKDNIIHFASLRSKTKRYTTIFLSKVPCRTRNIDPTCLNGILAMVQWASSRGFVRGE